MRDLTLLMVVGFAAGRNAAQNAPPSDIIPETNITSDWYDSYRSSVGTVIDSIRPIWIAGGSDAASLAGWASKFIDSRKTAGALKRVGQLGTMVDAGLRVDDMMEAAQAENWAGVVEHFSRGAIDVASSGLRVPLLGKIANGGADSLAELFTMFGVGDWIHDLTTDGPSIEELTAAAERIVRETRDLLEAGQNPSLVAVHPARRFVAEKQAIKVGNMCQFSETFAAGDLRDAIDGRCIHKDARRGISFDLTLDYAGGKYVLRGPDAGHADDTLRGRFRLVQRDSSTEIPVWRSPAAIEFNPPLRGVARFEVIGVDSIMLIFSGSEVEVVVSKLN